jgi:hypothetical protein
MITGVGRCTVEPPHCERVVSVWRSTIASAGERIIWQPPSDPDVHSRGAAVFTLGACLEIIKAVHVTLTKNLTRTRHCFHFLNLAWALPLFRNSL